MLRNKIARITAILLVAVLVLAGCANGGNNNAAGGGSTTDNNAAASDSSDSGATAASDSGTSSGTKAKVTVGIWENPVFMSYLAEAFMADHPDIEIEVFSNGEWLGNENMAKLVAANQMPDIINLENPVYPLQNDWVIDLKPYVDQENDLKLPPNFIKYGTYGGKTIMIPNAVYLFGVMVNKDLLAANNIDIPSYDWTIDEFVNIVKRTSKKGVSIGTSEMMPIMKHLPPQMNMDLGWGSFNESTQKYQLSPEWVEAANISYDLYRSNSTIYERLDEVGNPWDYEEGSDDRARVESARAEFLQELVGEDDAWKAWLKGKAATWFDFTWGMNFDNPEWSPDYSGFEWDYYPFPTKDGSATSRPGIVVDSIGITTKCAYPDAAWEFLKFLTFDSKGIDARFNVVDTYNKDEAKSKFPNFPENQYPDSMDYSAMPCTTDMGIIDRWVALNDAKPGIKFMMSNMDIGFVDGFKVTPGFDDAYHKTIEVAFKESVLTGLKSAADIVDEVTAIANDITDKAYAAMNK